MYGMLKFLPILLGISFVISMINVIVYSCRKRRQWENRNEMILKEGYMKLYLQIEEGQGEIFVSMVDDQPPLHSSEVIRKAIFLPPGERKIRLSARAKGSSISDRVLPYQQEFGPFEITVLAKKAGIATLYLNANTQNIYLKESKVV